MMVKDFGACMAKIISYRLTKRLKGKEKGFTEA
jgi:hypothetical protein